MTTLGRPARVAVGVDLIALAAVAFLAFVVGSPTSTAAGGTGMMGGGMMGGWGLFLIPLMLFAFAALLAFGYVGVRAVASEGGEIDDGGDDEAELDPVERLQRRYTQGELTEGEFERALERELEKGEDDGVGERDGEFVSAERSASLRER
jgi:uncharacterized membrane protein